MLWMKDKFYKVSEMSDIMHDKVNIYQQIVKFYRSYQPEDVQFKVN